MDGASQIPATTESLSPGTSATVKAHPVMAPEDLQKAGAVIGQAAPKYG